MTCFKALFDNKLFITFYHSYYRQSIMYTPSIQNFSIYTCVFGFSLLGRGPQYGPSVHTQWFEYWARERAPKFCTSRVILVHFAHVVVVIFNNIYLKSNIQCT